MRGSTGWANTLDKRIRGVLVGRLKPLVEFLGHTSKCAGQLTFSFAKWGVKNSIACSLLPSSWLASKRAHSETFATSASHLSFPALGGLD